MGFAFSFFSLFLATPIEAQVKGSNFRLWQHGFWSTEVRPHLESCDGDESASDADKNMSSTWLKDSAMHRASSWLNRSLSSASSAWMDPFDSNAFRTTSAMSKGVGMNSFGPQVTILEPFFAQPPGGSQTNIASKWKSKPKVFNGTSPCLCVSWTIWLTDLSSSDWLKGFGIFTM